MTREEALKKIRQMSLPKETMEILEALAPELAGSEDERILASIADCVGLMGEDGNVFSNHNVTKAQVLSWLEKQKEQKPVKCELEDAFKYYTDAGITVSCGDIVAKPKGQSEEPKIVFGDWGDKEKREAIITCLKYMKFIKKITNQEYDDLIKWLDNNHVKVEQKPAEKHDLLAQLREHLANTPKEQLEAEWKELEKWNHVGSTVKEYLGGIKPAEWSEEDKDMLGKVLECIRFAEDHYQLEQEETNGVAVRWWLLDHIIPQPKVEWNEEDEKDMAHIIRILDDCYVYGTHDLSKTDRENLVNKLKSLRPQPKPEWSEEDEENLEKVIWYIEKGCKLIFQKPDKLISWLKSLRPSWKPSEEQMKAVKHAYNSFPNDCLTKSNLRLLYHDLEKLM